jgi:cytochrome P450
MVDASLITSLAAAPVAVLGFALVVTLRWAMRQLNKPVGEVPWAPNALPFFHHTFGVLRNTQRFHDWVSDTCEQFQGKPFRFKIIGEEVNTVVNTPELFEDVFKTQFECFDKGPYFCEILSTVLGSGIFAVDGTPWMHQRKTASNLFTMRTLRDSMTNTIHSLLPTVDRIFQRSVDSGEPMDLVKFLNRFTMEAFTKIGFGFDLNGLDAKQDHPFMAAFDSAQRVSSLRFVRPRFVWKLLRWLQIGPEGELTKQVKLIDDTVLSIIARSLEQRQNPSLASEPVRAGKDIVSLFLDDVSHDSKDGIDPVFLRDIVVNFLIAGRDTTAQALSWLFYELGQNPHVEMRLREELRHVLPHLFERTATAGAEVPSMEQVQRLPYLEATLKETLRLHPSVPMNSKLANRDTVLSDGTFIPKGSTVSVPSYALGRATHVWGPDAKTFRPERWLDPQHPGKLITVSAFQFNAFNAGPRICLGMNLAMMEMKILVASVFSKFRMEIVPGQQTTYDVSLTLPVKGELLARIHNL